MVFGTTYCGISHLPIKDGDKCMLLPLGFKMKYSFDQWNGADVNSFMYLYSFIYKAQIVVYQGNPDKIKYLDKSYEQTLKHQLYMLVHLEFYNGIQRDFMTNSSQLENVQELPLFKTCEDLWHKAHEVGRKYRSDLEAKMLKERDKNKKQKLMSNYINIPVVPDWIKEIYKIAMFMDGIGMIPHPCNTVDQHNRNELYERLRSFCGTQTKLHVVGHKLDRKNIKTTNKRPAKRIRVRVRNSKLKSRKINQKLKKHPDENN